MTPMSKRSERPDTTSGTMGRVVRGAAIIIGVGLGLLSLEISRAEAAEQVEPPRQSWTFAGPLGKFDQAQLQRGFKVYREVCSNCHALSMVAFRNLAEAGGPGFTEEQAKAVAEEYKINDGPNDSGDMFERPGRLSDTFPKPFPNEQAARAANGGGYPPDMSTLAKARTYERGFPLFILDIFTQFQEQGPDYIHAILEGYKEPPADVKPQPGLNFNEYFPGHWIKMAQPIQDGQVEYPDGTPTTIDQYGKDIASFLTWAAEPHLVERKSTGLVVMFFLITFAGLLYYTKKKVWAGLKTQHA